MDQNRMEEESRMLFRESSVSDRKNIANRITEEEQKHEKIV